MQARQRRILAQIRWRRQVNYAEAARPPPAAFPTLSFSRHLSLPISHRCSFSKNALSLGITIHLGALHDRVVGAGGVGNDMPTTHDRPGPADVMMHGDGDGRVQKSTGKRWAWCLRVESRSAALPTISDTDWCGLWVEGRHHAATPEQVRRRAWAAWPSRFLRDDFVHGRRTGKLQRPRNGGACSPWALYF